MKQIIAAAILATVLMSSGALAFAPYCTPCFHNWKMCQSGPFSQWVLTPCGTPICTPNWSVGNWTECTDGTQTRIVTDLNSCGQANPYNTTQSCEMPVIIPPVTWSDWSQCNGLGQIGTQVMTSSDGQEISRTCATGRTDGITPAIGQKCILNTFVGGTALPKRVFASCWADATAQEKATWISQYGSYLLTSSKTLWHFSWNWFTLQ